MPLTLGRHAERSTPAPGVVGETGAGSSRVVGRPAASARGGAGHADLRGGVQDGVGVQAVMAVQVGHVTRLAERLDAQGRDAVAAHGGQPRQRGRVAVEHGDQAGVGGQAREGGTLPRGCNPVFTAKNNL